MSLYSPAVIPAIFASDTVTYECSCGSHKSLHCIYLCRHCHKIRCRDCLSHEVDSQYCQHCLEYIPTIDAKLKKNKCASCFQCPCCMHTLTTRALLSAVPSQDDPNQTVHKKFFFLFCNFCRWSSRDVGIPDQTVSTGSWPEMETPNAKRLDVLFDHFRMLAQKEKIEKEKKRISPRSAIHLLDKYGITPILSSKVTASLRLHSAKLPYGSKMTTSTSMSDMKSPTDGSNFEPSSGTDQIEPLDEEFYYKKELDLSNITTLSQRLMQVEMQTEDPSKLFPVSKMLLVKRSMRCKECDHNLSKPEYNPSSIKFKIQLSAYYHIPELRVKTLPPLKKLQESRLEVTLQNPTPYILHVMFLDVDHLQNAAKLKLPKNELILSPKDDTADLDVDQNYQIQVKDDPSVVSFNKGNKIGVYLPITPLEATDHFKVRLLVKHDFVNTVIQSQGNVDRQPQISWITHKITLNLGKVEE